MKQVIGQQGEVRIVRIAAVPAGAVTQPMDDRTPAGHAIISHSESGNHHVIADPGCAVMERTADVPAGLRILYAIVEAPTALRQDASVPHGEIALPPGIYEMRISREYDPFAEQARRVAD